MFFYIYLLSRDIREWEKTVSTLKFKKKVKIWDSLIYISDLSKHTKSNWRILSYTYCWFVRYSYQRLFILITIYNVDVYTKKLFVTVTLITK